MDEILGVLRRYDGLKLVCYKRYDPPDIRKFVEQVYSVDAVPIEHLKAKNEYLMHLPGKEVALLLCYNQEPEERVVGEGQYAHVQSMLVDRFKWDVRERFNPRDEKGERTEQHVIHGTDNETQTRYIWSLVEGLPEMKVFEPRLAEYPGLLPWYLPGLGDYTIKDVDIGTLRCTQMTDEDNIVVPLAESVFYRFLTGDRGAYIRYWQKFGGRRLLQDYSAGKFDDLNQELKYPPRKGLDYIIVTDDGIILDGNHRAAILLARGEKTVRVLNTHARTP